MELVGHLNYKFLLFFSFFFLLWKVLRKGESRKEDESTAKNGYRQGLAGVGGVAAVTARAHMFASRHGGRGWTSGRAERAPWHSTRRRAPRQTDRSGGKRSSAEASRGSVAVTKRRRAPPLGWPVVPRYPPPSCLSFSLFRVGFSR